MLIYTLRLVSRSLLTRSGIGSCASAIIVATCLFGVRVEENGWSQGYMLKRKSGESGVSRPTGPESGSATKIGGQHSAANKAWVYWLAPRLVIVAVVVIVFLNALPNSFHLDDYYRVANNPGIHKGWPPWRHFVDPWTSTTNPVLVQFRPLLPLTLSINYAIAGDSFIGYHLGNLFFHILSALLMYSLCLELLKYWSNRRLAEQQREGLALAVALIFGIHPVSGISVNYICARDLLIMECFLLASLLGYIRLRRLGGTALRWALVLLAVALSLLGKTNAAIAPLLVLLFDFFVAQDRVFSLKPWLRAAAFGAVVAGFFLYTQLVVGFSDFASAVSSRSGSPWEYPLTQFKVHLFEYMRNFFWPFLIRQMPYVEAAKSFWEPGVVLGMVFVLGTVVTAWVLRKRTGLVSFCILGYWALMIPESSVLPLHHLAAHYRAYAPSPFFYLVVALVAWQFVKPTIRGPALWILLAFFAGATTYLNTTWRSDRALWSQSVKYGGDATAHLNLGMSYADPNVRKVHLEDALRMAPNYVLAHIDLGLALMELGQEKEGLAHLQKAVALKPTSAQAHYWLAHAYATLDRKQEAARESAEAVRLHPRHLKYQLKAAKYAQAAGDYRGSLRYLDAILKAAPNYEDALFWKGLALMATKQYREAIAHFERALVLKPDCAEAEQHLKTCREKLGEGRGGIDRPHGEDSQSVGW